MRTLTVHAPFYDPDVAALGELITRLRPQRVRVLLTRNTSVDPITLQATLSGLGKHAELYEIAVTGDSATYIHAKWLHFIAGREELLLTGSANLSRSALLTTSPNGNIEIGVLQQRGPGGFEDLYAPLTLTPIDDLAALGLGFQSPEASHAAGATLIWSQLDGNRLRLVFVGDFDETTVSITGPDGSDISASSLARNGDAVTLLLTAADAELLAAGGPITVSVAAGDGEPGEQRASWPYQLRHLTERLRTVGRNRMLSRTGALPDTDKDLYELLTHLEQTLITDPVSAWKVVHPSVPVRAVEPDGESISWQDIDWDRLKRSPRYAAYHYAGRARVNPTDIEVILASISAQLNPQQPSGETGQRDSDEAEDAELGNESAEVGADPESAEEREAGEADDDEALRPRHLSVSTRTRMAFGRFVARYTNALANSDFVDMLGPTLTVHNAVIMHHLLRKLGERDGIDPLKAARAYLASWRLLWGSQQSPGLVAGLDSDERAAAEAVMAQGHLRAMTLQALVYPWFDALVRQDLGDELRDEAQYLCTDPTFALDAAVVHAAAPLPGQAVQLLDDLRTVAAHLGEEEVIRFVLRPFDLPASAAHWEWRRVRLQAADDRPAHDSDVRVLEVRDTIPGLTTQAAVAALARLAVATHLNDEDLEYWRIRFGDTHDMCFWDEHASSGICCVADDDSDLTELDVPWPDWWLRLEQIQADLAETVAA